MSNMPDGKATFSDVVASVMHGKYTQAAEIVETILPYVDHERNTVLHQACCYGQPELIRWLLNQFPDLAITPNIHGDNCVHMAIREGEEECLKTILSIFNQHREVILSKKDNNGCTPLHIAAYYGQANMLSFILGQISNQQEFAIIGNRAGQTAAHLASVQGHLPCVKILARIRPLFYVRDAKDMTCLHYACLLGKDHCVKYLVHDFPALVKHFTRGGATALHLAVEGHCSSATLSLLVEKMGKQLSTSATAAGNNALHVAAIFRNEEAMQTLLKRTMFTKLVNKGNRKGITAAQYAAVMEHSPCLHLLLMNRADVYQKNMFGDTVQKIIASSDNAEMKQLFPMKPLAPRSALLVQHTGSRPSIFAVPFNSNPKYVSQVYLPEPDKNVTKAAAAFNDQSGQQTQVLDANLSNSSSGFKSGDTSGSEGRSHSAGVSPVQTDLHGNTLMEASSSQYSDYVSMISIQADETQKTVVPNEVERNGYSTVINVDNDAVQNHPIVNGVSSEPEEQTPNHTVNLTNQTDLTNQSDINIGSDDPGLDPVETTLKFSDTPPEGSSNNHMEARTTETESEVQAQKSGIDDTTDTYAVLNVKNILQSQQENNEHLQETEEAHDYTDMNGSIAPKQTEVDKVVVDSSVYEYVPFKPAENSANGEIQKAVLEELKQKQETKNGSPTIKPDTEKPQKIVRFKSKDEYLNRSNAFDYEMEAADELEKQYLSTVVAELALEGETPNNGASGTSNGTRSDDIPDPSQDEKHEVTPEIPQNQPSTEKTNGISQNEPEPDKTSEETPKPFDFKDLIIIEKDSRVPQPIPPPKLPSQQLNTGASPNKFRPRNLVIVDANTKCEPEETKSPHSPEVTASLSVRELKEKLLSLSRRRDSNSSSMSPPLSPSDSSPLDHLGSSKNYKMNYRAYSKQVLKKQKTKTDLFEYFEGDTVSP